MTIENLKERAEKLVKTIEELTKRAERLESFLDEMEGKARASSKKQKNNKREKEASGSKAIGKTIAFGNGTARVIDYEADQKSFVIECRGDLRSKGEDYKKGDQVYVTPAFIYYALNK